MSKESKEKPEWDFDDFDDVPSSSTEPPPVQPAEIVSDILKEEFPEIEAAIIAEDEAIEAKIEEEKRTALPEPAVQSIQSQSSIFPEPGFNLEKYLETLRRAFMVEALSRAQKQPRYAAVLLRMNPVTFKRYLKQYEIKKEEIV